MSEPSLPPPSWPAGSSPPPAGTSAGPGSPPPPPASVPPPPPATGSGADWAAPDTAPPGPPGGSWDDPDRGPEPRRSRGGLVVALVAVVLLVVGGLAVALLAGTGENASTTAAPSDLATADEAPSGDAETTEPAAPADDGDLDPAAATAHRELFAAIDASEREMIALSESTPVATNDLDEQELAAFEEAATAHVAELERIRGQLTDLDTAGDPDVTAIRDAYVTHLQDWIDWGTAVGSDPTLVDRPEAAGPYFDAINFSADGFATAVERNLDRDAAPDDVVDLADEILERGFSGDDGGTEI